MIMIIIISITIIIIIVIVIVTVVVIVQDLSSGLPPGRHGELVCIIIVMCGFFISCVIIIRCYL